MRVIFRVLFCSLILIVTSCNQRSNSEEYNLLNKSLQTQNVDVEVKYVIIIPGAGCNGCIQSAEMFLKENISNRELLFVLTRITSLKLLQHKIETTVTDYPNVVIDREGIFELLTHNGIYPCIVKLIDGEIESIEFQSPQNSNAFSNLQSKLTQI